MQRRAAAVYFVLLLVVGVGAYAYIDVAEGTQEPEIELEGTTLAEGDTTTINGVEYAVSSLSVESGGGGGHGGGGGASPTATMAWTNDSAQFSAQLANNDTVSAVNVVWEGQAGRSTAELEDGSTVQFNGSEYSVATNASAGSLTLEQASGNGSESFGVGDTVQYQNNATVLTQVSEGSATLAWGDDYRVRIPNESDVSSFTMRQEINTTQRLVADDDVYDQTVTINGTEHVTYRENDTNVPLDQYLPEPTTSTISEGDTVQYQGNETVVANVTTEAATLEWGGTRTETVELEEGGNVTLAGGNQYFAHFPNHEEVVVAPQSQYGDYAQWNDEVAYFEQRIHGLWGVAIIALIGAILLLGMALMPVRG
ncbi:hypothetical protein [Halomicrobium salinisoli]|uniref:hypothetical protein n=1 Tax=Halomicrobium salinisoli TaxID=2878391 RepID=UPI001CF0C9ED|nr:hypothetical protein [Halomicrobium salinisoli]